MREVGIFTSQTATASHELSEHKVFSISSSENRNDRMPGVDVLGVMSEKWKSKSIERHLK